MNDSISRQAAIETVKKHYRVDNDLLEVIAYEIEALPSAQLAQDLLNGCTDTISRAAALSALNGLTKIFLNNLPPTIDRADAVDAIKALPSAQPGWIPVTERLPKPNEYENDVRVYYLVQNEYGDMMVCSWHGSYWTQMYRSTKVKDKVVAWMPLPTPYREGGQDGET